MKYKQDIIYVLEQMLEYVNKISTENDISGLCDLIKDIEDHMTKNQYALCRQYLENNLPTKNLRSYSFPEYEIKPRVEWLEEQLDKQGKSFTIEDLKNKKVMIRLYEYNMDQGYEKKTIKLFKSIGNPEGIIVEFVEGDSGTTNDLVYYTLVKKDHSISFRKEHFDLEEGEGPGITETRSLEYFLKQLDMKKEDKVDEVFTKDDILKLAKKYPAFKDNLSKEFPSVFKDSWREKLINPKNSRSYILTNDPHLNFSVDEYPHNFYRKPEHVFAKEEHAQLLADKMTLMQEMHAFAHAKNEGWKPDWEDRGERKHGINYVTYKFYTTHYYLNNLLVFGVAVKSEEIAEEMLEEFRYRLEAIYNKQY